jgi:hypothetical protein
LPHIEFGPISVRRWQSQGQPVRHGPLTATPVARVTEARWQSPGVTVGLRLAWPHQVVVRTLAGDRRLRIRQPDRFLLALLALALATAVGSGRLAERDEAMKGERRHDR